MGGHEEHPIPGGDPLMPGGRPKRRGPLPLPDHLKPRVTEFPATGIAPIEKLTRQQKAALTPPPEISKKGRETGRVVAMNRGVDYTLNDRGGKKK